MSKTFTFKRSESKVVTREAEFKATAENEANALQKVLDFPQEHLVGVTAWNLDENEAPETGDVVATEVLEDYNNEEVV